MTYLNSNWSSVNILKSNALSKIPVQFIYIIIRNTRQLCMCVIILMFRLGCGLCILSRVLSPQLFLLVLYILSLAPFGTHSITNTNLCLMKGLVHECVHLLEWWDIWECKTNRGQPHMGVQMSIKLFAYNYPMTSLIFAIFLATMGLTPTLVSCFIILCKLRNQYLQQT